MAVPNLENIQPEGAVEEVRRCLLKSFLSRLLNTTQFLWTNRWSWMKMGHRSP